MAYNKTSYNWVSEIRDVVWGGRLWVCVVGGGGGGKGEGISY